MTMTSNDRSTERVKSISRYHCVCREDANLWNLTGVVGFESNESEVAADKDKDKPMITIVSSSRSLIETGARLIKSAVPPSLSLRDERNRTQVAAAINRWAQTHPSPPPPAPVPLVSRSRLTIIGRSLSRVSLSRRAAIHHRGTEKSPRLPIRERASRGMLRRGVGSVQAGARAPQVPSVYARTYIRLVPVS